MSLATRKKLHAFICTELPINDQVISRVNDLSTKEEQRVIIKGYQIFEWILGTPIKEKDDETKCEEDEISSTNEDEHDYDITENVEDK